MTKAQKVLETIRRNSRIGNVEEAVRAAGFRVVKREFYAGVTSWWMDDGSRLWRSDRKRATIHSA